MEQDRKKVSYYHGGHEGALASVLDRLKKRTLSRETLARSKVSKNKYDLVENKKSYFKRNSVYKYVYVSISSHHDHYRMMIGKIICLTMLAPLVNTFDAYLQLIHLYFFPIRNCNI